MRNAFPRVRLRRDGFRNALNELIPVPSLLISGVTLKRKKLLSELQWEATVQHHCNRRRARQQSRSNEGLSIVEQQTFAACPDNLDEGLSF